MGENHFAYPWFEKCHLTHLMYVSFVFRNPPLLKSGINKYFYSNFMSFSSQKKKQKRKRNKIESEGFVVEGVEEEEELVIQFQAPRTQSTSQPSLSLHFLLHLPSEFLSFPPSPICISSATTNPTRLPSFDPTLLPTQLANLCSPFCWPSSPIFLHSSLAQLPFPNVFLHSSLTLTLSSVPYSRQPMPWVSLCSMWVLGLMVCGFDGGGFWPW